LPLARLAMPSPRITPPLRSTVITAASSLLRTAPSLDSTLLLSASPFGLVPFACHCRRRFPQFSVRARNRLALPLCRTRLAHKQVLSRLIPEQLHSPVSVSFDHFRHLNGSSLVFAFLFHT